MTSLRTVSGGDRGASGALTEVTALAQIADLAEQLSPTDLVARLAAATTFLHTHLLVHAHVEEAALYPVVDWAIGARGATATMARDHAEIARMIRELDDIRSVADRGPVRPVDERHGRGPSALGKRVEQGRPPGIRQLGPVARLELGPARRVVFGWAWLRGQAARLERGFPKPPAAGQPCRGRSTMTTSSVRGPWTPSIRLSSMSLVADGPLIQVSGRVGRSWARASGTVPAIRPASTTQRW